MKSKNEHQKRKIEDAEYDLENLLQDYKKLKGFPYHKDKFGEYFRLLYNEGVLLAEGSYGEIYLGVRRGDNMKIAIKRVLKENIEEFQKIDGKFVPKEVVIWKMANRIPGVIKLLDTIEQKNTFLYIMETPERGMDLSRYIDEYYIKEKEASKLFKQIVKIVIKCKEKGVFHGDIKTDNLLIDFDTRKIKMIDFGFGDIFHDQKYKRRPGTFVYAPPEYLENNCYYGESMTVWQLGITLFKMLQGRIPFCTKNEIKKGEWKLIKKISEEGENVLRQCLSIYPGTRIKLEDLITHQWFNEWYDD